MFGNEINPRFNGQCLKDTSGTENIDTIKLISFYEALSIAKIW